MQFSLITVFALACAVPLVGAAVSLILLRKAIAQANSNFLAIRQQVDALTTRIAVCEHGLQQTASRSPAALAGRVDDLTAAVDAHAARVRKELGKLWGTIGAERSGGTHVSDRQDALDLDHDLASLLALQQAPPGGPK